MMRPLLNLSKLSGTVCVALIASASAPAQLAGAIDPSVTRFVTTYCLQCHNEKQQKGDRSFESFLESPDDQEHLATLEEILDLINLGEMPPAKKNVPQPTDSHRRRIVDSITKHLTAAEADGIAPASVLRRLSRDEYNNTMRDLLGVHPDQSDATRMFPIDQRHDGFTNVGAAQVLSDYQLQLYMKSARFYLDQALVFGQSPPKTLSWAFPPSDMPGREKNPGAVFYHVWGPDQSYLDIGHGEPVDRYPTYPQSFTAVGTPRDGIYRIRVKATAVGRKNPYASEIFPNDLTVPLKLGVWHVPDPELLQKGASEGRVLAKVFDLPDDDPEEFEVTTWMPAGSIPFVNWMNGMGPSKQVMARIVERYHPEARRKSQTDVDRLIEQGLPVPADALVQEVHISDVYQGPRVRIFELALEGPIDQQWPPLGHRRIFGDLVRASDVDFPKAIKRFATLAYRRPVEKTDLKHYIDYAQHQLANGATPEEAIKTTFTAILCSPRLLFLDEGNAATGEMLDGYELASRLSYTFWSSMPDDELVRLARSGSLHDPKTLETQIDRLLADPRSEAFNRNFTEAWLRLDKIGMMPPSNSQYPSYYHKRLESAMKNETRLFFNEVLHDNRPVTDFIDADFTFVNDSMANHYGLAGTYSEEFRRVTLPDNLRRSGLLGHASVLTATSNGVETSPVVRGVWVLENILGTPPSPPPPDVPPIEPDTRGATTIRQQLAKHRSVAACADCHAKIDPWGFALEFFDPIGGLRTHYPVFKGSGRIAQKFVGKPVDGSSQLPSGEWIHNEGDLQRELLERRDLVTRNLIQKFLTYATGRDVTFRDNEEVNAILGQVADKGYGLRDLVVLVTTSEAFRRR
tara:strand:+ start:125169 stop:127739 length:2571 start_codon:yes stop_codon:yes gene_type:complete